MTEVVSFPKLAFPMFSLDPKAGAQGTNSPYASSHQSGEQALKQQEGGCVAEGR